MHNVLLVDGAHARELLAPKIRASVIQRQLGRRIWPAHNCCGGMRGSVVLRDDALAYHPGTEEPATIKRLWISIENVVKAVSLSLKKRPFTMVCLVVPGGALLDYSNDAALRLLAMVVDVFNGVVISPSVDGNLANTLHSLSSSGGVGGQISVRANFEEDRDTRVPSGLCTKLVAASLPFPQPVGTSMSEYNLLTQVGFGPEVTGMSMFASASFEKIAIARNIAVPRVRDNISTSLIRITNGSGRSSSARVTLLKVTLA